MIRFFLCFAILGFSVPTQAAPSMASAGLYQALAAVGEEEFGAGERYVMLNEVQCHWPIRLTAKNATCSWSESGKTKSVQGRGAARLIRQLRKAGKVEKKCDVASCAFISAQNVKCEAENVGALDGATCDITPSRTLTPKTSLKSQPTKTDNLVEEPNSAAPAN